jgi:hypothetical protein
MNSESRGYCKLMYFVTFCVFIWPLKTKNERKDAKESGCRNLKQRVETTITIGNDLEVVVRT